MNKKEAEATCCVRRRRASGGGQEQRDELARLFQYNPECSRIQTRRVGREMTGIYPSIGVRKEEEDIAAENERIHLLVI